MKSIPDGKLIKMATPKNLIKSTTGTIGTIDINYLKNRIPIERKEEMKKRNNINDRYRLVRQVFQNKTIPIVIIIRILTN